MPGTSVTRQTVAGHLSELRRRLFWIIVAVAVGSVSGYLLRFQLLALLIKPLNQTLYYSTPGGGFNFVFSLSLIFGFTVSLPVIVYQLLQFIAPVFPQRSPKMLARYLVASCALVLLGAGFAYFVSLPAALRFLNDFSTDQVHSLISSDSYLSFVATYLGGFAALFQLPLILLLVNKVQPLPPSKLLSWQKWVIVLASIVAAVLTPTQDPVNMLIMAVPIVLLYQVSILLVWLTNRRRRALPDPLQGKQIVSFQPAIRGDKSGFLCLWEGKGRRASHRVTTFLYEGKHTLVHDSRLG
jgi:sec-independent protein translocase protein TatC